MATGIKISSLNPIGANIAYTTLVPVVNMSGVPTTEKATAQVLGNLILNGAGGSYFPAAAQAVLAQSVTNAAQPNITSVGTLTSLNVTGTISAGSFSGDGSGLTNLNVDFTGYATETYVNSAISNIDLSSYATETYVNNAISNIDLSSYATQTYVNNAISNIDLSSYATQTYVNDAIANVTVDLTGYATETFVNTQIDTQTLKLSTDVYQDVTSSGTISLYTLTPNGGWGPSINFANTANFSNIGLSNVLWNSVDVTSSAIFMTFDWNNNILPNGKVQWQFTPNGDVVFPDGTTQSTAYTGGTTYDQSLNTTDSVEFANVTTTGTMFAATVENPTTGAIVLRPQGYYNTTQYEFGAPNSGGRSVMTVPSDLVIKPDNLQSREYITLQSNYFVESKVQSATTSSTVNLDATNIYITADTASTTGTSKTWRFSTNGIRFPDNTVQTTAFNGTEKIQTKTGATGVVTHDCSTGAVFYHTSVSSNFTANITNLVTMVDGVGRAGSVTLVIAQGATPYICNAVQINGAAQTILWQGSASAPTGNANKTDIITFSIMQTGLSSYIVFGQLVTFG